MEELAHPGKRIVVQILDRTANGYIFLNQSYRTLHGQLHRLKGGRDDTRPCHSTGTVLIAMLAVWLAFSGGAFPDPPTSRAVQAPRMALDMQPAGNTYDDSTNTMTVGEIDNCLTSDPGNNSQHNHTAHLTIQDVEDLVGWQARMNYDGARMRPSTVNFTPFADNTTGQNVSFLNLPLDGGVHRDIVTATDIPPQSATFQTAIVGAVYNGEQNTAVSPDTPAKSPPDDSSYTASGGGVLASINVQVAAGQAGLIGLYIDLDDWIPNDPGSDLIIFTGSGTSSVRLTESSLGDGFHSEGGECIPIAVPAPPDLDSGVPTIGTSASTQASPSSEEDRCPEDFNADDFIDTADIAMITGQFGKSVPPADAAYDLTADGSIDTADIARVTANFGAFCLMDKQTFSGTQAVSAEARMALGEEPVALSLQWKV